MEIVVRTDNTETVVRPEGAASTPEGAAQGAAGTNAGPAPSSPDEAGAPPANVAATEPPRAVREDDQSAGGAPKLE